jgi:vacuolar-type H+-ATPase subunit I/STV1
MSKKLSYSNTASLNLEGDFPSLSGGSSQKSSSSTKPNTPGSLKGGLRPGVNHTQAALRAADNASIEGLLHRIEVLRDNSHFYTGTTKPLLNQISNILLNKGIKGEFMVEDLIRSFEELGSKLFTMDEKIEMLERLIEDLQEKQKAAEENIDFLMQEKAYLSYVKVFGDVCSFILKQVHRRMKTDSGITFESIKSGIFEEREEYNDSDQSLKELYSQENHGQLKKAIEASGWTVEEYEEILAISSERNGECHSDLNNKEIPKREKIQKIEALLADIYEKKLPSNFSKKTEILKKATEKVKSIMEKR